MALSEVAQIKQLLQDHQYLLVVFPPYDTGDALASALAFKAYATASGKQVDVVGGTGALIRQFKFLAHAEQAKIALTEIQKFIIKVDVSRAPIETLSYDIKEGWLSIYLTPKTGVISKNELRTAQSNFKYDAIIVLGATDLAALGDVYLNNTDLFFRLPIINIDRAADNERFGHVNYIGLQASSLAEFTYTLLKQLDEHLIGPAIATALLAGMIAATKSFTSQGVTPHTLRLASELVDRGADREKIITHLYRTRSVATLKLWGAALARLHSDRGIVHTNLTREDFARSGAAEAGVFGIIEELLSNAPEAKIIIVTYEIPGDITATIKSLVVTGPETNALALVAPFAPQGTPERAIVTTAGKTLGEAEQAILETIKKHV